MSSYALSYRPKVRVEVYFPIRDQARYKDYLEWLIDELTRLHGGCTVLENMSGYYCSQTKELVADRVNVVYSDFEFDWSKVKERAVVLEYCAKLRQFLLENLWEEEVLISAYPVSHVSQ